MKTGSMDLMEVKLHLGPRVLFPSLTLTIKPGEVVTIMGENGCGKSSLLAWICGTLPDAFTASGTVSLNGENISQMPAESRRIGILFQDDLLFPHMTVGQNLAFALTPEIRSREARRRRVEEALSGSGLAGFYDRDPSTLSGGQKARAAVMRVLLSEPRALLLDEPFSKLDETTRRRFQDFVLEHVRDRGLPTLMVTHDPKDATAAGGPIIRLQSLAGEKNQHSA